LRIISGSARGRRLKAPAGKLTRPTSDRVREAIFNILGAPEQDMWVLDLFAGSGALGLEALSRGAAGCLFVEQNPAALQVLRRNVAELGFESSSQIQRGDALRALKRHLPHRFGWIFVDPPYRAGLYQPILELVERGQHLAEGGLLIVEHDRRHPPAQSTGCLIRTDHRQYGDTEVSFYRCEKPS
jgi:16S rRNA (guanine(966)-N(2))-methyltransferase RsmD